MRSLSPRWIVVAVALIAIGCANQKGPAEQAVAKIDAEVAAIRQDAAKLAPGDLQGVEASIASLKEKMAKGDYKAVLADAPAVTSAVDSLRQTVASKKAEAEAAMTAATAEWNSLSADVPKMVEAIQSRVDILGKSRKLPKNVSQEAFDAAKSGLDSMKATWAEATAAFASGDSVSAVAKANSVKQQGNDVLQKLGMTAG
jgi:paraquat-inducible protein B